MEPRYSNAIDANTIAMLLYGEIGSTLDAEYFTYEMRYYNSMGKKLKVYINSPGGSVFGGYGIIQAIKDFDADTHVVGLAASMAGVISQFGKRRTANDFAQMMIHLPSGADGRMLDIVKDNLLEMLSSRCKEPKSVIEKWMEDEVDFNAEEMLSYGFIDEIIRTNVSDRVGDHMAVSDRYKVFNQIIEKQTQMKNLVKKFSLEANATEKDILNAIEAQENEYTEEKSGLEAQISKLQAELEELRTANTSAREAFAESIVDQAIEDGKIDEEKRDNWVEAAKKDPETVKAQLESIRVVTTETRKSVQNTYRKQQEKKHEDAAKKGDPKDVIDLFENPKRQDELLDLHNSDRQKFNELSNQYLALTGTKA